MPQAEIKHSDKKIIKDYVRCDKRPCSHLPDRLKTGPSTMKDHVGGAVLGKKTMKR